MGKDGQKCQGKVNSSSLYAPSAERVESSQAAAKCSLRFALYIGRVEAPLLYPLYLRQMSEAAASKK
jgi:hypothetical protein